MASHGRVLVSSFETGEKQTYYVPSEDGSEFARAIFDHSRCKNFSVAEENSDKLCDAQFIMNSACEIAATVEEQENEDKTDPFQTCSSVLSAPISSDAQVFEEPTDTTAESSSKKTQNMKAKEKNAILQCEWNMCTVMMQKMEKFLAHIAGHAAAANAPSVNEGHICLWRNCGFTTHSQSEFERHIYFHAFHAKIKGIGEIVKELDNLECTMDDQSYNVIPEFPEPFECMWVNCNFNFTSAQDFYWHVHSHAMSVDKGKNEFLCSWKGCTFYGKAVCRLQEHVRRHTQEKVIGCPDCGAIFASISKYRDHCHRHKSQELQMFECSHCKSKFASERLLKEHVRRHINHFKCPHCEMTCTTRGTLDTHIKYRHTNNKPFKCPECNKRFKFQVDVAKHLSTHSAEPCYMCFYPGCYYSCRSYSSYCIHMKKTHEGIHKNPYICHMCDKTFCIGVKLTIHLKKMHDYHWPAGHTRFRYSKDEEGYYRLQTTRYESMELAQEFMKETDDDPDSDVGGESRTSVTPEEPDCIEESPKEVQESRPKEEEKAKKVVEPPAPKSRRGRKKRKRKTK